MAKGNAKNKRQWYDNELVKEYAQDTKVQGIAKVTKMFFENEKVKKFGLEFANITDKGNVARCWVTCSYFGDKDVKEEDIVFINGYLTSNEFKGNWSTEVVAKTLDIFEMSISK